MENQSKIIGENSLYFNSVEPITLVNKTDWTQKFNFINLKQFKVMKILLILILLSLINSCRNNGNAPKGITPESINGFKCIGKSVPTIAGDNMRLKQ